MKRLLYIFFTLALCACEIIPEEERLIPVSLPSGGERRHVLLEFTGFRCVNCPTAAETALNLQSLYGNRLLVVALHPASNPFTQGLYDYTCPAADSIYRLMGGTATTPFPAGNIDMMPFGDNWFIDPMDWPARVNAAMADTLWNPYAGYETSYWLIEDSILGAQAMPDGSVDTHYYHRHVLRAVSAEPLTRLPEQCDPAHCSVLTIYTDPIDNHILQAYENPFDLSAHP